MLPVFQLALMEIYKTSYSVNATTKIITLVVFKLNINMVTDLSDPLSKGFECLRPLTQPPGHIEPLHHKLLGEDQSTNRTSCIIGDQ